MALSDFALRNTMKGHGEYMTATKRIPNPYLLAEEMLTETGVAAVDEFLFSLTNILQVSLASHLRAIYLIGSYVEGDARPDSDIDLCLLWKTGEDWQMLSRKAWTLIWLCTRGSGFEVDPMWNHLETPFYSSTDLGDPAYMPCGPIIRNALKEHSRLLWGEDIRPQIAPGNLVQMQNDVLMPPINWMRRMIHHPGEGVRITIPLTAPNPAAEHLGYCDQHKLIIYVFHIARALIFLQTGEYIYAKRAIAGSFRQFIGTPWDGLVESTYQLAYLSLDDEARQACYIAICRQLTAFENEFLQRVLASGHASLLEGSNSSVLQT